jgi:C-terminal processing protease CtpA/Prc
MTRLRSRLTVVAGLAAALTVGVLGGGAALLAHDDHDDDHIRIEHKGKIRIQTTDEDGNTHEEVFDFDGPRPFLGIVSRSHRDGVRVDSVVKDSGAEAAGLEAGDIIVGFNGEEIERESDLTRMVLSSEVGDRVDLEILRDGDSMNLSAELGERDDWVGAMKFGDFDFDHEQLQEQMERLHEQLGDMKFEFRGAPGERHFFGFSRPVLGVQLTGVTPELREHLGASPDAGVLVSKVMGGMPAEEAGIRVGDLIVAVDGREIESASDLSRALRRAGGETLTIDIVRDGSPMSVSVFIPEPEEVHESSGPRA